MEERPILFKSILFENTPSCVFKIANERISINKLGGRIDSLIVNKLTNQSSTLERFLCGVNKCYFHNGPTYFIRAMGFMPNSSDGMMPSSHYKEINTNNPMLISCVLNSSLFYWFYKNISNCRDFSIRDIGGFPLPNSITEASIEEHYKALTNNYVSNRAIKNRNYNGSIVFYEEYYPSKAKRLIDSIDVYLAKHYGFTEEELDFIINYDIKYRMGDELNEE